MGDFSEDEYVGEKGAKKLKKLIKKNDLDKTKNSNLSIICDPLVDLFNEEESLVKDSSIIILRKLIINNRGILTQFIQKN